MHRLLLAVLLLTVPLAGCVGTDDGVSAQRPDWPSGLLLTYEIANGSTATETFLVQNRTEGGADLWAWNLSRPDFSSPLLAMNDRYNPDDPLWGNVFDWPIEPGDEHEATIDGVDVTMTWSETEHEGTLPTDTDVEGIARDEDGNEIARFRFTVGQETVLTFADIDVPDGVDQTWRLEEARLESNWRGPPSWTKGDWWTYNGSFRNFEGNSQIVYTTDKEGRRSDQYQLEPVEFEDRFLMVPFLHWRKGDIAPQSGFVSGRISSFWSWPLVDGKTWTGSTSTADGAANYAAQSQIQHRVPLPDGTVTTTFNVEVFAENHEEAFAEYEYAPRVGHIIEWTLGKAGAEGLDINFTLEDWGEAFHGEMQIPRRQSLAEIPVTSGPATINESFEVSEDAMWVRIAPGSFAGHGRDVEPEFHFRVEQPGGEVVSEHNESDFADRRLDLSGRTDAVNGTWSVSAELGEDVTLRVLFEALWYEVEERDYRDEAEG